MLVFQTTKLLIVNYYECYCSLNWTYIVDQSLLVSWQMIDCYFLEGLQLKPVAGRRGISNFSISITAAIMYDLCLKLDYDSFACPLLVAFKSLMW
jgi:hypothetical protein